MSSIYDIFCTLISDIQPCSPERIKLKILQLQDHINLENFYIYKAKENIKHTINRHVLIQINLNLLKMYANLSKYIIQIDKLKQSLVKTNELLEINRKAKEYALYVANTHKQMVEQMRIKSILELKKSNILQQLASHKSPDILNIVKQTSGRNNNGFAKCDMILEENCIYGTKCPNINNPLMCSLNHFNLGKIIKMNDLIPIELCRYERPWIIVNGGTSHCTNIKCYFSHLNKRKKYIDYIKKIIDSN